MWDSIRGSGEEIPKFEETALPGQLADISGNDNNSSCLRRILNCEMTNSKKKKKFCKVFFFGKIFVYFLEQNIQSPNPSATDRFLSPGGPNSSINRQLFPSPQSGQSLLQKHTHLGLFNKIIDNFAVLYQSMPRHQCKIMTYQHKKNTFFF